MELDTVYRGVQNRWMTALNSAGPEAANTPVPACPSWSVRDVTAHVTGLAEDAAGGSLPAMDLLEQWRDEIVATMRDAMTARQIDRAGDEPLDALIARWEAATERVAPMMRGTRHSPPARSSGSKRSSSPT